jgi:hypothetical protein
MSKIKKIVLQIGEKEIELSLDEAKELKKILGDLFKEKETVYVPSPYPVYPYFPNIWRVTYNPLDNGITYVSSGSSTSATLTSGQ